MATSIGKKIQLARKDKGLTLKNLAVKVGSSPGYLSEVENNKKIPGGELLISLSRILEINLISDPGEKYAVTQVIQNMTPEETGLLSLLRSSAAAHSIFELIKTMDEDSRRDIKRMVEKEKLFNDLINQKK